MKLASHKNLYLSLLLMSSFALSGWLIHSSLKSQANSPSHPTTPDTFMTEIYYTQFNSQGQWQNSFYSPRMSHYQQQNLSLLTTPRMVSQGSEQFKWIITAQSGISQDNGKQIDLKDHVKITRLDLATQKETTLTTEAMTAYPQRKYLITDQPVTITEAGSIINSRGFTADLNTGDISLLSNAHGVYQELS